MSLSETVKKLENVRNDLISSINSKGGNLDISATLYNCVDEINNLQNDSNLMFHASLNSNSEISESGHFLTIESSVQFTTYQGIPCAQFTGSQKILAYDSRLPNGTNDRTIAFLALTTSNKSSGQYPFGFGKRSENNFFGLFFNGSKLSVRAQENSFDTDVDIQLNAWSHYVVTYASTNEINVYKNGALVASGEFSSLPDTEPIQVMIGAVTSDNSLSGTTFQFVGYIADVRIYNKVLTKDEIDTISKIFNIGE